MSETNENKEPVTVGSDSNEGLGDPVFLYRGEAYNRPVGRGVTIGPRFLHLEDMLPEGDLTIEIRAWVAPSKDRRPIIGVVREGGVMKPAPYRLDDDA